MPKFNYDGPMPTEQMKPNNSTPNLLRQVLEALAIRFGWEDWSHYHRNNYHHAKEIKDKVYHMSVAEKVETLNNCKAQTNVLQ